MEDSEFWVRIVVNGFLIFVFPIKEYKFKKSGTTVFYSTNELKELLEIS